MDTIVVLAIEAYIFAKFQISLKPKPATAQSKTIPTYLTLFIFGFLYELVLVWDSLRLKNTIQVIGLCIYNIGMLIYASIQFDQVDRAISALKKVDYIDASDPLWHDLRPYLLSVPIIIGFFTVVMSFVAWKLYDEFAWTIYKHISADLRMKRRFLTFQIYIALLKFDFFFFLGFTVQFLVIVTGKTDAELGLTIAAIPITIGILFMAAFWTRRENKFGMIFTILLFICGLAYFIFKLARMYSASHRDFYITVRKNLTSFACITILLIVLTIANAIAYNMAQSLIQAFNLLSTDSRVKTIVLTSSTQSSIFCAGADLEIGLSYTQDTATTHRDMGGQVALAIHNCKKPVIAAITGSAVGVGITMTLPCAIRVVSDKAKVGFVFARRGILETSTYAFSANNADGSIGVDPKTSKLVEGGVADRTAQSLKNLAAVLEAAVNVFLTNMEDFAAMNNVYAEVFSKEPKPVRTCVAVAQLPLRTDVEIECIAHFRHNVDFDLYDGLKSRFFQRVYISTTTNSKVKKAKNTAISETFSME
ncbi:putative UPF0658 Golgi apparatus membrane protein C23H3.04 [Glarea lozoyensis 74030]|uniref:Putative UPF0658 Golgi apparatus membrane protein C23H3.04 n=1 Tax=Glarea lozoyensis (strain ATCC 74030 / MF5533) TaxID=1104152 RepID=H0EYZ6_GLAL7|nr:putative UPF0658 Golgi apparatus membrane protein C23H3.04 [Glarea lozoyensis 74030]